MDHDPTQLTEIAIELALGAGEILRSGRERGFGSVTTKSSSVDIVTEIDHASEAFIVHELRFRRPNDAILAEEGSSYEGTSGVKWVVDPLDGTVNFTYDIPNFAVCIGIEIDGSACAGVVYNPAADELFTAISSQGAYLNETKLQVQPVADLSTALVATGFSYSSETRTQQGFTVQRLLPQVRDIRRLGSAGLDLCNLAAGRVDAYYEISVWPWDITAATVVAREAGATVTGFFNETPTNDVIAASSSALHASLKTIVSA